MTARVTRRVFLALTGWLSMAAGLRLSSRVYDGGRYDAGNYV